MYISYYNMAKKKENKWAYVPYFRKPRDADSGTTCPQEQLCNEWIKEHLYDDDIKYMQTTAFYDWDDTPDYRLRGFLNALDSYESWNKLYEGATLVIPYRWCIPEYFWEQMRMEDSSIRIKVTNDLKL